MKASLCRSGGNSKPDTEACSGCAPLHAYLASDVCELAATYIFIPEICHRSEMHPWRAASWLRSKGLLLGVRHYRRQEGAGLSCESRPLTAFGGIWTN